MPLSANPNPIANRLLYALPEEVDGCLRPELDAASLGLGDVVYDTRPAHGVRPAPSSR
jgi:hypothetical protein